MFPPGVDLGSCLASVSDFGFIGTSCSGLDSGSGNGSGIFSDSSPSLVSASLVVFATLAKMNGFFNYSKNRMINTLIIKIKKPIFLFIYHPSIIYTIDLFTYN